MPTREEIREGIQKVVTFAEVEGQTTGEYPNLTQLIISYLHSQGVVIKVDGELPTQRWDEFMEHDWVDFTPAEKAIVKGMLKAGYTKTVPLIEGVMDEDTTKLMEEGYKEMAKESKKIADEFLPLQLEVLDKPLIEEGK